MGGASSKGDSGGDNKTKFGYTKPTNPIKKIVKSGGVVLNLIKNNPVSNYTEKVNRDYYNTKVKNYKGNTKGTYEDYIRARGRGEVDAMGRPINNRSDDNSNDNIAYDNNLMQSKTSLSTTSNPSPTNAEITQAQSTNMSGDEILLANKKKGRSETILNQAQGLGDSTANTTKKKLGA